MVGGRRRGGERMKKDGNGAKSKEKRGEAIGIWKKIEKAETEKEVRDRKEKVAGEEGEKERKERKKKKYFFFNDTATTEIYTLSLHDALPICCYCVGNCYAKYPISQNPEYYNKNQL